MNRTLPLVLLVTSVFAVGSAMAANAAIRYLVKPDGEVQDPVVAVADATEPGASRSVAPRARTADQYLDVILGQNIFDPAERDRWAALKNKPSSEGPSGVEAPTEIDVKLLGTVVATDPNFSSALIVEGGKDHAYGYGIGDDLLGREVVAIDPKRVTLKFGTKLEYLTMDEEETPVRTTSSGAGGTDDDGIEDLGDGKYALPRELFDKYVTDLEAVQKMGRALLHRGPDGNYDGYRLSAIRRGSLPDKLGIKNGDVIHSVNGTNLDSMQNAMGAYQTMRSENNFCLEVTRRGSPQTLCYDLQ